MKIMASVDAKSFEDGMVKAQIALNDGARAGVFQAAAALLHDAIYQPPACPIETGRLRDAHKATVEQVGVAWIGKVTVSGVPYAASLHEGLSRWGTPYKFKTPGTGAKWLEAKAVRYRGKYSGIMAENIKAWLQWSGRGYRAVRPEGVQNWRRPK